MFNHYKFNYKIDFANKEGKMKFGIHSLLFTENFLEKDIPLLEKFKNMGFDAVEINPYDPDNFPAKQVKKVSNELGISINIGYGMPEKYNIISPDVTIRKEGVKFLKKLINLSNEAGAVVFGGVIYCSWGYITGKMRTEDEWKWGVEAFREIAQFAKDRSNLILGVEPINRFESHFINIAKDAVKFIKDVDLDNVYVLLDTFHMIREEDNIRQAIKDVGKYLGYIHACENQRGIPGTGLIPWREFFIALKEVNYNGCITIESFDPNMVNMAKLCSIWRKLADSPEQLAIQGLDFLKKKHEEMLNN